jgi:hypothetical protein
VFHDASVLNETLVHNLTERTAVVGTGRVQHSFAGRTYSSSRWSPGISVGLNCARAAQQGGAVAGRHGVINKNHAEGASGICVDGGGWKQGMVERRWRFSFGPCHTKARPSSMSR